jgi:hypothetical protein
MDRVFRSDRKLDAVAELKGKLDAVLILLGQKEFKSAEMVEPPCGTAFKANT